MALIRGFSLFLMSILLANMLSQNEAQSSGCTSAVTSLSPCLNYIMGSSSTPSASCCSQLSSVVQSSPQCLCSVLNGGGSTFGISINQTLALSLPGACKVQTPPITQCKGGNGSPTSPSTAPVDSPVASPSDSSSESPQASITPSASSDFPSAGAGSKNVPSTVGGSSNGSVVKVPSYLVLYLLAILSCVSAMF